MATEKALHERLGERVMDRLSGIYGELRAVAYYQGGSTQCGIAPATPARDGDLMELQWIAVDRLEFTS